MNTVGSFFFTIRTTRRLLLPNPHSSIRSGGQDSIFTFGRGSFPSQSRVGRCSEFFVCAPGSDEVTSSKWAGVSTRLRVPIHTLKRVEVRIIDSTPIYRIRTKPHYQGSPNRG